MIDRFKRLKIASKLWMLVLAFFVVMFGNSFYDLSERRVKLQDEKQLKTRHLVESAYSVLDLYYKMSREAGNGMSEEEAKRLAIRTIRAMRYEAKEYFWINDLSRPAPSMVMHPTVPALDGKVLDDAKFNKARSFSLADSRKFERLDNKNLFIAFVDVVEKAGHGFVIYDWPKPVAGGGASTELYPKLSYVKKFEAWGWLIGSGIYIDDLDAAYWAEVQVRVMKSLFWIGLLGLLSWVIGRGIIRPIDDTASAMDEIAKGDGDLSKRLAPAAGGSIERLAIAFNNFASKIENTIGRVNDSTSRLAGAASQLSEVAQRTRAGVEHQEEETVQVARLVSEVSSRAHEVAASAVAAADAARAADQDAAAGKQVVDSTVSAIRVLADNVRQADAAIALLQKESSGIGSIVNVINEIANQTNLLALNAAIEAARAGEQGRGFAVVADEVRVLAQRTQESTKQIRAKIETLQKGTTEAAKVMSDSRQQAEASVDHAAQAGESLEKITRAVATIAGINADIVGRAQQQAEQAERVNGGLEEIKRVGRQTADDANQTQRATGELAALLAELQGLVRQFKLTNAGKFDFDAAISAHLAWKARIRSFLDGSTTLTREQAVSHRHCMLGKWYYGEGIAKYGSLAPMRDMEPPHEELHKVIAAIVEAKHAGRKDEAERLFMRIEPLSTQIVARLEETRRQVAANR